MIRTTLVLCCAMVVAACEQAAPQPTTTWIIPVEGMHCDSCAATLQHMARGCDGVQHATASFQDGALNVELLDSESVSSLQALVTQAGYTAGTPRSVP